MSRIAGWLAIAFLGIVSLLTFLLAWGFSESFAGTFTPPTDGGLAEFSTIWAIIIAPWFIIFVILRLMKLNR